jgi:polar amino acid transport system substrate-binding protein
MKITSFIERNCFLRKFCLLIATLSIVHMTFASPPTQVVSQLAPSGKLRAGVNLRNTLFTSKDQQGHLTGLSIDLMQELANRLGVPLELVVFETPGQVADSVNLKKWDLAILAIEQTRAKTISFSTGLTKIEASYMVHKASAFQSAQDVDQAGVRISAPEKAGYELYLTQHLQKAELVRTKDFSDSYEIFNQSKVEAVAGLTPMLIEAMPMMPQGRIIKGGFMTINHGFAMPHGQSEAQAYVNAFAQEMTASGFIKRSIEKHGVKGISSL